MALDAAKLPGDVARPCLKVAIERDALRVGLALEGCQVVGGDAFSNY